VGAASGFDLVSESLTKALFIIRTKSTNSIVVLDLYEVSELL
jgi:hypothetical protein